MTDVSKLVHYYKQIEKQGFVFGEFRPRPLTRGLPQTEDLFWVICEDVVNSCDAYRRVDPNGFPWSRKGWYVPVNRLYTPQPMTHLSDWKLLLPIGMTYWGLVGDNRWSELVFEGGMDWKEADVDGRQSARLPKWIIPVPRQICADWKLKVEFMLDGFIKDSLGCLDVIHD